METFTLTVNKPIELMELLVFIRELQHSHKLPDDMLTFVEEATIKWSLKGFDEYDNDDFIQRTTVE